ncbi:hypothetical protein [Georgenia muralis]
MNPRRSSAAAVLGLALAAAVGLAACSNDPEPTPALSAAESSREAGETAGEHPAETTGVTQQAEADPGEAPPPLDPGIFGHEDFVGAIEMEYRGDRTSESAVMADSAYDAFFGGDYDRPAAGEKAVLRLTAMVDPRDGNRLLMMGAVIDTITDPNELVIGLHNVLGIDGSVALNGEEHEGRVAGASGVMEVGDRVTIWTPHPGEPDLVYRYVYEVVPPEDAEGSFALYESDLNIDDKVYRESPSEDVYQLSTYICWPPNQLAQRLVTRLHLVESSVERGSVAPLD